MAGACRSLTFNAQARYANSGFATGPFEPAGRGDIFSERLSNGERPRSWLVNQCSPNIRRNCIDGEHPSPSSFD